jgi:flagellar protein FliS
MNGPTLRAYRRHSLNNASGAELVAACFREARSALAEARRHIEGGTAASSYASLERVRRIYTHLYGTLDLDAGGTLAVQMQQLYAFVIEHIMVVSSNYDLERLSLLENITDDMRLAWQKLATPSLPASSEPHHPVAARA